MSNQQRSHADRASQSRMIMRVPGIPPAPIQRCALPFCYAGLQQVQLDVSFLRPRLLQLVGGAEAEPVAQLLDDVVAAAADRSTDPPYTAASGSTPGWQGLTA